MFFFWLPVTSTIETTLCFHIWQICYTTNSRDRPTRPNLSPWSTNQNTHWNSILQHLYHTLAVTCMWCCSFLYISMNISSHRSSSYLIESTFWDHVMNEYPRVFQVIFHEILINTWSMKIAWKSKKSIISQKLKGYNKFRWYKRVLHEILDIETFLVSSHSKVCFGTLTMYKYFVNMDDIDFHVCLLNYFIHCVLLYKWNHPCISHIYDIWDRNIQTYIMYW